VDQARACKNIAVSPLRLRLPHAGEIRSIGDISSGAARFYRSGIPASRFGS
jgi:uncharacterized protein (DUF934 family)